MEQLHFIRQTLYTLKRQYGFELDVYRITNSVTDVETGVKVVSRVKYTVDRAIVLPSSLIRKDAYDLAYFAANKNFTYGATFDVDTRMIVLDADDLPIDFEIKLDDFIVFNGERYQIKKSDQLDNNLGFAIIMQLLKGIPPRAIINVTAFNSVRFVQRVTVSP